MFDSKTDPFLNLMVEKYFRTKTSMSNYVVDSQVTKKSNVVRGTNTSLTGQINVQVFVVIRGQSYKVVGINLKRK